MAWFLWLLLGIVIGLVGALVIARMEIRRQERLRTHESNERARRMTR